MGKFPIVREPLLHIDTENLWKIDREFLSYWSFSVKKKRFLTIGEKFGTPFLYNIVRITSIFL